MNLSLDNIMDVRGPCCTPQGHAIGSRVEHAPARMQVPFGLSSPPVHTQCTARAATSLAPLSAVLHSSGVWPCCMLPPNATCAVLYLHDCMWPAYIKPRPAALQGGWGRDQEAVARRNAGE